ncbi:hypothetical protein CK203_061241 [Vitis vinifera]|uniref:Myb-like domain-containing protein n=1 Tax=Vitis vinifera TaxID=29760 RepID=A0A438GK59_VITVI|nr:hypothetical protein CK203_061241 [Vitis vinifera]
MSQFIDYSLSFGSKWNRSGDILFERAILIFPEETPNRWYKIVTQIPRKSPMDVLEHYIKSYKISMRSTSVVWITTFQTGGFRGGRSRGRRRTPSQVASHAQKYFARQRLGNMGKKRKRTSIHDITTDDLPPLGGVTP